MDTTTHTVPTLAHAVRIGSDLSLYRERERAELIITHAHGGVLVELVDRQEYERERQTRIAADNAIQYLLTLLTDEALDELGLALDEHKAERERQTCTAAEESAPMLSLLKHLTEKAPDAIQPDGEELLHWVLTHATWTSATDTDFNAIMSGRPEHRTPLQRYWVNMILCGREEKIIPEDLRMKLDPDDPRVLEMMAKGIPVDEAAEAVVRGGK